MMARLGQLIKKLNIGISTATDFLHKKGETIEANPNLKLTENQESLLIKEFCSDKDLKLESERISQQRQEKEKATEVAIEGYETNVKEVEEIKIEIEQPHITQVGTIDLGNTRKNKKAEAEPVFKEQPIQEEATLNIAEEVIQQPVKEAISTKEEAVDKQSVPTPMVESQPEEQEQEQAEISAPTTAPTQQKDEVFVFRKHEVENNIKVVDKIDLSAINNATRPAKKTKEEKRKERIEKEQDRAKQKKQKPADTTPANQPNTNQPNNSGQTKVDKKKRKRIGGNGRIDVTQNNTYTNDKNAKQKFNNKRPIHGNVINEEDVAKQIKETLARLTENKRGGKKAAKYRKDKREANVQRMHDIEEQERQESKILKLTEFVTANELAVMMNIPVTDIIKTCLNVGLFVSINQRLDAETINIVAEEYGFKTEFVSAEVVNAIAEENDNSDENLVPRPPIITVMGHVDHGKTSLLDYIRKTNVIAGEAGGITQHIGAYNVQLDNGRKITFLDTPGHEAFTAMRARGAKITDIAIIIIAADDNVMPQTIEAINHAAAAGVPIVFAINKIDKPGANPEKIKEELANMNYLVEDWGGKYQSHDISAKKGLHVQELLEKVLLEADILDLKANPDRKAVGSIIESSLDKGRGYIATVLVQNGTLKVGDIVLAGTSYGRIKAMFNERNQRIQAARPSEPAIILGLNSAPQAGDNFNVLSDEHEARTLATKREQLAREQGLRTSAHLTLDEIGRRIALGNFQELNVIVKGDVDGSIEALSDSLIKLSTPEIQVNVIHKGVGQIAESDIMLAAASNAIIIGFQVRPSLAARKLAEQEQIDIRLYSIIYDAIEELKAAMEGMLSPDIKEVITATLEIREVFKISKVGSIAGCIVKEGKIKRANKVRLIRDGIVIYTGDLASLKRMKEDVKEVSSGFECGLNIGNYNDIKVGDIVESYEEVEIKKSL
ncbi:MAG: translation initiation factor IF-2 [Sphingobacteriia bacterium]|nr:translation initiation factor IF-2 [Sphingobacteriia bacterium]